MDKTPTPRLTFELAVEALTGSVTPGSGTPLRAAVIDSREVIPGSLFVALQGEQVNGHDFLAQAFERGARAALVERDRLGRWPVVDLRRGVPPLPLPEGCCLRVDSTVAALQQIARYWRSRLSLRVIGITGSVGKSTTKEVAAELLERRFRTLRNLGNLNNEIGLPLTILRLTADHSRAVLEMGFYVPGEIALLCDIARPQVGVITNIGPVHLERAGSMEAIVAGKRELVESLPPAPEGVAILNFDDERVKAMAGSTRARVFSYGLTAEADLWADQIVGLGLDGVRFALHHGREHEHIRVPMLGRHSVHTALRAAAIGLVEGLSWEEILAGLQSTHAQLRLVAVPGPEGSILLDDTYNAAPESTIAALNLLAELEGRRLAVLGDMLELGAYEEAGHRMVGARAAEVVDELVTVGTRARWIAEEAARAGLPAGHVAQFETAGPAIEALRRRIGGGDVVLIKGSRGMHMDQIVDALAEGTS
ncbi:MAG TPA: UDP-N-acetylmuramoyl-tripeptide--D-alanyl-D-alanine ligase [Anaerolineales bacterium]|nr:UDP-N-acetylmuramoyl-tripeptide--D-alanyl-D-alanine ligase [Anaerolineales bacterium]